MGAGREHDLLLANSGALSACSKKPASEGLTFLHVLDGVSGGHNSRLHPVRGRRASVGGLRRPMRRGVRWGKIPRAIALRWVGVAIVHGVGGFGRGGFGDRVF